MREIGVGVKVSEVGWVRVWWVKVRSLWNGWVGDDRVGMGNERGGERKIFFCFGGSLV